MCDSTPVQTTALRGLMASLALPSARPVESDGHTRSTCGVRELRDAPVRRSVRQRAAAARRPTSIVCWWRSGDAGGAETPPLINKPRDLRFGAQFKPSARAALPRPFFGQLNADRLSGALSICRTQQIACSLHTRHRERRTHSKRGRSVDLRRRQVWMLDSCRGE